MTIDLQPLALPAPKSSAGAPRVVTDPRTLTLRLTRAALLASHEPPMGGTVAVQPPAFGVDWSLRAAVLPVNWPALTITF